MAPVMQLLGQISRRRVAGDFVVLDALRGADQREVGRGVVLLLAFVHHLLAFLDEPHHALAGLGARGGPENAEAFVEPLDLRLGLLQVHLEQALQLRGAGRLGHLRQRLEQLLFGMQDVAQLIDQEFLHRLRVRRGPSSRPGWRASPASVS